MIIKKRFTTQSVAVEETYTGSGSSEVSEKIEKMHVGSVRGMQRNDLREINRHLRGLPPREKTETAAGSGAVATE